MNIQTIVQHFAAGHTAPVYAELGKYKPFSVQTMIAAENRGYIVEWISERVCYVHAPGSITQEELKQRSLNRDRESADRWKEVARRTRLAKYAPQLLAALEHILLEPASRQSLTAHQYLSAKQAIDLAKGEWK